MSHKKETREKKHKKNLDKSDTSYPVVALSGFQPRSPVFDSLSDNLLPAFGPHRVYLLKLYQTRLRWALIYRAVSRPFQRPLLNNSVL
jgi:hypothetical protein